MLNTQEQNRLAELLSVATPNAEQIAELRELSSRNTTTGGTPSRQRNPIALEGYAYFASLTAHDRVRDGQAETYHTASFELAVNGKAKHIDINLGGASIWIARLKEFTQGQPCYVSLSEKVKGADYVDRDSQVKQYNESGFMIEGVQPSAKPIVDRAFEGNKVEQLIAAMRALGCDQDTIVAAITK